MSAPGKRVAAVVAVIALLAGAGLYVNARLRAPATDHAIDFVPADARAYFHVFLKPSTAQRRALRDLLEKFPETDEEDEARSFVSDLLRDVLARFEVDVDPGSVDWLGEEAAAYLPASASVPTVILAVDDEAEARAQLTDALGDRLEGELELSFVDDFAIVGPPSARDASVRAREDGSLATSSDYDDVVDRLDDDRIALFFTHGSIGAQPAAATLRIREADVVIDAVARDGELLRFVEGFFVAGFSGISGSISIAVPPPFSASDVVSDMAENFENDGTPMEQLPNGFLVNLPAPLAPIEVTSSGERVIASMAASSPEVEEWPAGLEEASRERLQDGFAPTLTVDVSALPAAARLPFFGPGAVSLRAPIEQFLTLDLGLREDDGYGLGRVVVRFSDA